MFAHGTWNGVSAKTAAKRCRQRDLQESGRRSGEPWRPGILLRATKPYTRGQYTRSRARPGESSSRQRDATGAISEERFENSIADGRIWWGRNGDACRHEALSVRGRQTGPDERFWPQERSAASRTAKNEMLGSVPGRRRLSARRSLNGCIERVLDIATDAATSSSIHSPAPAPPAPLPTRWAAAGSWSSSASTATRTSFRA